MPIDKFPLVVKEFKGKLVNDIDNAFDKYAQGHVPFDYGLESINLEYLKKGGMRTRRGLEEYIRFQNVTGVPRQFWKIDTLNGITQVDRWLILTWDGTSGRLYDTGVVGPATNPVLTLTGMKYAFVLNAFGRMYISAWEGWATPLGNAAGGGANNWIWLYNGNYNARLAGSPEPVPGAFAVAAAAGGNVTAGLHLVSVIFETDSGYRSRPPTAHITVPLIVTTTTANATINGTNVPTGPTGTAKRHIIITKVVVNNNGQGLLGYEPFIAITINDNTTTTFSFTGPDSGLVDSAKDWVLALDIIRTCVSMATYKNRLIFLGMRRSSGDFEPHNNEIAISRPGLPEQVNFPTANVAGTNVIVIGEDFSGKVIAGAEIDNTFYIFKEDSTFSTVADDDLDPSEWPKPSLVDSSRGAFPYGVAQIGNNPSTLISGRLIVGGNHGISIFDGRFSEKSLAESIWEEYDQEDLKWLKIVIDPIRYTLFAKIGDPASENLIDGATPNNFVLFNNYYYGYDITQIRWGKYILPVHSAAGQLIAHDIAIREPNTPGTTGNAGWFKLPHSLLVILDKAFLNPNYDAWIFSEALSNADFGQTAVTPAYPIWEWMSGYTPNENGETFTFGPLKIRINTKYVAGATGNGNVIVEMGILDDSAVSSVGTLTPGITPKKFMSLPLNNVNEQLRIRVRGQNHSLIHSMILFATERGKERPR